MKIKYILVIVINVISLPHLIDIITNGMVKNDILDLLTFFQWGLIVCLIVSYMISTIVFNFAYKIICFLLESGVPTKLFSFLEKEIKL